MNDLISRQAAIDALDKEYRCTDRSDDWDGLKTAMLIIENLTSAQPERKWISCANPPKHHKNVIVKGIEAIGNVTVYKVMQWDVDTWRPEDYAPSIRWLEWCEI